jgi:hypothetical protein
MPEPEHWSVTIALPRGDLDELRLAIPTVIPGERHGVITEIGPNGEDGDSELVLDVLADSGSEATAAAIAAYEQARAAAGLPLQEAEIVGLLPPMFGGEVWDRLWEEAQVLHIQGRHELAVVRAQTACECLSREALAGMLRARVGREREYLADAIVQLCRATLNDGRTQQLIRTVTGDGWRVTSEPWWQDYQAHLRRRNGIVHHGLSILPEDAVASLGAAESCMNWLRWMGAEA